MNPTKSIALLHGAGYAGGEIIRLLNSHPLAELTTVTSRTFAGEPVWRAHAALRGTTNLRFTAPASLDLTGVDAVVIAAEHGQSASVVVDLLEAGYDGAIVDLSADFRFGDESYYRKWFDFTHPAPALLDDFVYGLPEIFAPYPADTRFIANPGCFATGLSLALAPLAYHLDELHASVTALTGASGSGTRPKTTTHFPTRDGNVRAYKVLAHQHLPEVEDVLGDHVDVAFVPASGPWTRGIWGTAHVRVGSDVTSDDVNGWYQQAYGEATLVRLSSNALPDMLPVAGSPFCDIGWHMDGSQLVVGFTLDNLLKGAASQAVQNLNLVLGLPETAGLLPQKSTYAVAY